MKKVKAILEANYKWIKTGYKFYSTSGGEVPSVTANAFLEFINTG